MSEIVKKAFYNASDREFTFLQVQDVEGVLEANKRWREMAQRGDLRKVATIPNVIMMQWLNEEHERGNIGLKMYSDEWDELVARKLSDPDWAHLKTHSPAANGWLGFGS